MSCVCGSFQCTCQEKCTCMAKDCSCEECNELRYDNPPKSDVSKEISPTRGATTLLTDLQISDDRSTSVGVNYPDSKLLFPEWTSYGKTLSNASEQSIKEISEESGTHSGTSSPKTHSPKRKLSTTKEPSPSNIKRLSPFKNDQSEILPKTLPMGDCPPDTGEYSPSKSEEVDKSGPADQSTNESPSQTDSNILQDPSLTRSLKPSRSTCNITGTSESKNTAVDQRKLPARTKHVGSSSSKAGFAIDKLFLSAHHINKSLNIRTPKSDASQNYSYKSKSCEKKEYTSWQSKSGKSSKSKEIAVKKSEASLPTSSSDRSSEASASAIPSSVMQSTVKGETSKTFKSSLQESSKRWFSLTRKHDPFAPVGNSSIPRRFPDICAMDLIFQKCVEELGQRWVDDEDNESSFAPRETNPEAANSSVDIATSQEREESDPLVPNPESNIFEGSDSETPNRTADSPESQVVPDID